MPASIRVILKPLGTPGSTTLDDVASARVSLVRNGAQNTLAGEAPQPAELTFSLVAIEQIRGGSPGQPQPLATLAGSVTLQGGELLPRFDAKGNDVVPLVAPAPEGEDAVRNQRRSVVLELDAATFGEARSLTLPLPALAPLVKSLEVCAELKIGGATESPIAANDRFDFSFFGPKPVVLIKVVKLAFLSDHNVLLDNVSDFARSGNPITRPHWVFGVSAKPISHTKNIRMRLEVEIECHPANADEVEAEVVGRADFGAEFKPESAVRLKGGITKVTFSSVNPLQNEINKLVGEIKWQVTLKDKGQRKLDAGSSFGHAIYLTFAKPENAPLRERGITVKRMDEAVRLIHDTKTLVAQEIIQNLRGKNFPGFTLDEDPTINPAFNHPNYFNDVGGAWRLLETPDRVGHCQALVRIVVALCKMVGMPGQFETIVAFADPDTGALRDEPMTTGESGGLGGIKRKVNGRDAEPFLTTNPPGAVGRVFDLGAENEPDLNTFEACLRFTDEAGLARIHPGGLEDAFFDKIEEVVPIVFKALILVSRLPVPADKPNERKARLERIVKAPLF
jgi:hypothetical protein